MNALLVAVAFITLIPASPGSAGVCGGMCLPPESGDVVGRAIDRMESDAGWRVRDAAIFPDRIELFLVDGAGGVERAFLRRSCEKGGLAVPYFKVTFEMGKQAGPHPGMAAVEGVAGGFSADPWTSPCMNDEANFNRPGDPQSGNGRACPFCRMGGSTPSTGVYAGTVHGFLLG
ncbi:MAG: hypothetical protein WC889_18775, partial [Myxococcota bacterium]